MSNKVKKITHIKFIIVRTLISSMYIYEHPLIINLH